MLDGSTLVASYTNPFIIVYNDFPAVKSQERNGIHCLVCKQNAIPLSRVCNHQLMLIHIATRCHKEATYKSTGRQKSCFHFHFSFYLIYIYNV